MKLNGSERRTLIVAGTILAGLLLYRFVLQPFERKYGGVNDPTAPRLPDQKLLAEADVIRARHKELARSVTELEGQFPPDTALEEGGLSLLTMVENVANKADLTLFAKGISRLDASGEGGLPEAAVEAEGKGDARALTAFLSGLLTAPCRMDVKTLQIMAVEDGSLEVHAIVSTFLPKAKGAGGHG